MNPKLAEAVAVHIASKESLSGQVETAAKRKAIRDTRDTKFTSERLRETLFEQIRRIALSPPTDQSMNQLAQLASAINRSIEVECMARAASGEKGYGHNRATSGEKTAP